MSSEFDNSTKLLFVLTGFMAIMVGLIAYVAVFKQPDPLLDGTPTAVAAAPGAAAPEGEPCDATSLEGPTCPEGKYCRFDVCVQITETNLCGEGSSCRDCECESGLL